MAHRPRAPPDSWWVEPDDRTLEVFGVATSGDENHANAKNYISTRYNVLNIFGCW